MASSTQFSIRSLMVVTFAVAVLCTAVAPMFRTLEASQWTRAIGYLLLFWGIPGIIVLGSWVLRRRVEKRSGRLLARSDVGGALRRWLCLFGTLIVAWIVISVAIFLASVDSVDPSLITSAFILRITLVLFTMFAACEVTGLLLHWWWGTGFHNSEIFENGIVVNGFYLVRWSKLESYERTGEFTVEVATRQGVRPTRIQVTTKECDQWERILRENGVSSAKPLLPGGKVSLGDP